MITIVLWLLLAFALAMAASFAIAMRVATRWSLEVAELQAHGVEVTGRVVEKRRTRARGTTSTCIRYEYVDQFGKTHRSRRNLVTPDAWAAHDEGGPIAVVYSQRKPGVSWPTYLLSLAEKK